MVFDEFNHVNGATNLIVFNLPSYIFSGLEFNCANTLIMFYFKWHGI